MYTSPRWTLEMHCIPNVRSRQLKAMHVFHALGDIGRTVATRSRFFEFDCGLLLQGQVIGNVTMKVRPPRRFLAFRYRLTQVRWFSPSFFLLLLFLAEQQVLKAVVRGRPLSGKSEKLTPTTEKAVLFHGGQRREPHRENGQRLVEFCQKEQIGWQPASFRRKGNIRGPHRLRAPGQLRGNIRRGAHRCFGDFHRSTRQHAARCTEPRASKGVVINGVSASGGCSINLHGLGTPPLPFSWSYAARTVSILFYGIMVQERLFRELDFVVEFRGEQVAKGFVFKLPPVQNNVTGTTAISRRQVSARSGL